MRKDFMKAEHFFKRDLPKLQWTVGSLIEQGTFVLLGGEPKTSKTWAALDICLSVASGMNAFGDSEFHTEPRPVFMFLLEDGEYNVMARLQALAKGKGISDKQIYHMPMYLRCRKPLCIDEEVNSIVNMIDDFMREHELMEIRKGLILIDPLRNAHHKEENDSGQMRQVMEACLYIRDRTGYSILVNHHFKKMTAAQQETPGNAMRGSSSIYGSVDGIIGMRRIESEEKNTWRNNVSTQVKAGPQAAPFGLELVVEDGDHGRAKEATWKVGGLYG